MKEGDPPLAISGKVLGSGTNQVEKQKIGPQTERSLQKKIPLGIPNLHSWH